MIIESFGVVTGLVCVWLAARNIIWNFPVQIVSVLLYMYIFYDARLYADMGLQVYFLGMAIYGWYYWINRSENDQTLKPVRRVKSKTLVVGIPLVFIFTALFGTFLHLNTDAFFPFLDSFCAGGSLLGAFLLSRRILENWLVWIVVDIIYLYLYLSKELYLTTFLYSVYILIAIFGYREWKKNWLKQYGK